MNENQVKLRKRFAKKNRDLLAAPNFVAVHIVEPSAAMPAPLCSAFPPVQHYDCGECWNFERRCWRPQQQQWTTLFDCHFLYRQRPCWWWIESHPKVDLNDERLKFCTSHRAYPLLMQRSAKRRQRRQQLVLKVQHLRVAVILNGAHRSGHLGGGSFQTKVQKFLKFLKNYKQKMSHFYLGLSTSPTEMAFNASATMSPESRSLALRRA